MPARRFLLALLVSLLLHGAILGGLPLLLNLGSPSAPPTPAPLMAHLKPVPPAEPEPVVKDTIAKEAMTPPPQPEPSAADLRAKRVAVSNAKRKLAEHVFYPEEALLQGLEGEVRLLVTLAPDGRILDVQVASGSGHRLLDEAALEAVRGMGALPGLERRELILPVAFHLKR